MGVAPTSRAQADEHGDAKSRIEHWIEETEETLEEAQQPHLNLRFGPLEEPRARSTTGTSWLPDRTPSYALLFPVRRWGLMVRGNVFAGYGWGAGPRGAQGAASANTLLLAALGGLGRGELVVRTVLSWEAYTLPQGSPAPLHHRWQEEDRLSPHRLFHELAVQWTQPLGDAVALQLYFAPNGAPALGPADPSFRPSAFFDPIAPLGTHVLENTHSVPFVSTVGLVSRSFKLEGSWFVSPPRDPPGYGLVARRPDAGSVRLSVAPTAEWSLSVSYGHLQDPWIGQALDRWMATAVWSRGVEESGIDLSLISGMNRSLSGGLEPGATVELSWTLFDRHTAYGRLEAVREDPARWPPGQLAWSGSGSLSAGYVYAFFPFAALAPSLGVRGQLSVVSRALRDSYGGAVTGGFTVYAQLRQRTLPRFLEEKTDLDDDAGGIEAVSRPHPSRGLTGSAPPSNTE